MTDPFPKEDKTDQALAAAILLVLLIPSILFRGLVLSYLWLWFIVPLGVVTIGIANAIGISTLLHFAFMNVAVKTKAEKTSHLNHVVSTLVIGPVFILLVGWIIHLFM